MPPPRWKKGESGNPGGRPKGASVRDALRSLAGAKELPTKHETIAYAVAAEQLRRASSAQATDAIAAAKLCIDNIDGPVPTKTEISGPDGRPLFELTDSE